MSEPQMRTATRADLDLMFSWAEAEGWNPGLDDAGAFLAADPDGFLVAEADGAPAACISVVRYNREFGFLGFYICRPERRGQGLGWAAWQAGIDYLAGCTIGLDGVVEQQDNYRKSGFTYAHANMRYRGMVEAPEPAGGNAVAITADLMPELIAYDRRHFPAPRQPFLDQWLQGSDSRRGFALVEDGAVTGYGVIRACHDGFKIGPLFADGEAGARSLFQALAATRPGAPVVLDVPVPNEAAVALAESHGMQPVFETARMYRGPAPDLPLGSIYGITTFELG